MCNNVDIIHVVVLISSFVTHSGQTFRLFSSDAGTYKEARPFFTSSKHLVEDFYTGDLAKSSTVINGHTFVFAMYYAHFCGISRRMREPFEKAAALYRERLQVQNQTVEKFHVKFLAIDCFYRDGPCRKTYKLNYFPHLFLYIKGIRGYQYFGPARTTNLIEFIEKIRYPLIRITTNEELFDFLIENEFSLLAHFNLSDTTQRQYFSLYTQTALKHIEYDNEHPIRFGVILNQTVDQELFQLNNQTFSIPYVVQHRFNSKLEFYSNLMTNFTVENFFNWILDRYEKPQVGWIVPKNRYYSRSPSLDKSVLADALAEFDNLLVFFTSNKFDELKLRHFFITLSNCNITRWKFWLDRIEKLDKERSVLKWKGNSSEETMSHPEIQLKKRKESLVDSSNNLRLNWEETSETFRGLFCRMNITWALRLIDTRQYPNFLRILETNHSRAIVVFQKENQYIFNDEQLSSDHLYRFISDISEHLRSRSLLSTKIHLSNENHRLIELTTETFHSTVINTRKNVLVVYYTKWCGFCRSLWPILYRTKDFFQNFDNLLFTRIQADKHDLPWHLTVFNYPTMILFPAENKMNSVVFPSSTESLTSVGLIRFLLYHLYIDPSAQPYSSCQQRNNSFWTMLSSSVVDFSQLSSVVKSFS